MKQDKIKFIKNAIVFMCILLSLILICNHIYVKYIFEEKQIYRKGLMYQDFIKTHKDKKIDYIFFGDSRTGNGASPEIINNSFNYGLIGETYMTTYYKVLSVINNPEIKVKTVVFQIDVNTFAQSKRDMYLSNSDVFYYSKDMSYEDIHKLNGNSYPQIFIQRNFIFVGNGEDMRRLFLSKPKTSDIYLGWTRLEGDFSNVSNRKKAAEYAGELEFNGKPLFNNETYDYFLKTIKVAKENNITIVFVTYPSSKEYLDMLNSRNISREELNSIVFSGVNQTIGNDYEYYDYSNLFENNSSYFSDPEHLNEKGAREFTKILKEKIQIVN